MDGGAHMHELLDELCDAELCAQAQQSKTRPSEMLKRIRDQDGCTRRTYVAVLKTLRRSRGNQRRAHHCRRFTPLEVKNPAGASQSHRLLQDSARFVAL